jgi:hypothetical protein
MRPFTSRTSDLVRIPAFWFKRLPCDTRGPGTTYFGETENEPKRWCHLALIQSGSRTAENARGRGLEPAMRSTGRGSDGGEGPNRGAGPVWRRRPVCISSSAALRPGFGWSAAAGERKMREAGSRPRKRSLCRLPGRCTDTASGGIAAPKQGRLAPVLRCYRRFSAHAAPARTGTLRESYGGPLVNLRESA